MRKSPRGLAQKATPTKAGLYLSLAVCVFNVAVMPTRYIDCEINQSYRDLLNNEQRYLLLYGGAGSGKSHFAAQKILLRMLLEPNQRFLVCRKVARTIRNSQFRLFKDLIAQYGLGQYFSVSEQRMEIICTLNGNQIISTGVDDPEKLKSLAQPTGVWVEEATELSAKDFHQLDLRLRGQQTGYLQLILTFNPVNKGHWLYQLFVANNKPDATVRQTTWRDNHFLDEQYLSVLQQMRLDDPDYYKIYALGQWGMRTSGAIYRYDLVDAMPETDLVLYGLDFGYNNPSALVKVGLNERDIYVQELIYKHNATNNDLIGLLRKHVPSPTATIYADAAEPGRIEEIYRAGFNIHPARKEVQDGIDRIKSFRLHVVKGSTNLINELDSYQWKQDRAGHYLDEPEKANDHACDAMRYAVHTHFTRKKNNILGMV